MANDDKKEGYTPAKARDKEIPKLLGLAVVSAASAVVGGVAVAWWYRKTLAKLQNPIAGEGFHKEELQKSEDGALDGDFDGV